MLCGFLKIIKSCWWRLHGLFSTFLYFCLEIYSSKFWPLICYDYDLYQGSQQRFCAESQACPVWCLWHDQASLVQRLVQESWQVGDLIVKFHSCVIVKFHSCVKFITQRASGCKINERHTAEMMKEVHLCQIHKVRLFWYLLHNLFNITTWQSWVQIFQVILECQDFSPVVFCCHCLVDSIWGFFGFEIFENSFRGNMIETLAPMMTVSFPYLNHLGLSCLLHHFLSCLE